MIDADAALNIILKTAKPLPRHKRSLQDCVDYILAEELRACCDLPPFDNCAMDGFAVRAQDVRRATAQTPALLALQGRVKAGESARGSLRPGSAFQVMTGAPLPQGADAVVIKERAQEENGRVRILSAFKAWDFVRCRGEDVRRGQILLRAGTLLRPYDISLLAAQGFERVPVVRRPKVAVIVSGDELVDWRKKPPPARIRNSNGPALQAALKRWGYEIRSYGIVPDKKEKMRQVLKRAVRDCDVLLVSGGVSVGDYDYTRSVLEYLGFKTLFWKVAIKPGRPLLFGIWDNRLVFGLPGNPISSLLCAEEFVRPALQKLEGRKACAPIYPLRGIMAKSFPKPKNLRQYVFCIARKFGARFMLEAVRPQGSAMMGMASRANALAIGPRGFSRLEIGMEVDFRWLR